MYKAVFIDMDGTLLQKDHTISPYNQQILQQLIARDIKVMVVSARPLHGILPIIETVLPDHLPVVSLNGSYIYHQGNILFDAAVPAAQAARVHEVVAPHEVARMYYSQMDWFADQENDKVKKEQRITQVPVQIQPFPQTLDYWESKQTGPNKMLIAGDAMLLDELQAQLREEFTDQLNIYKSQSTYLEVMHYEASKTKAVQFLMKRYDIQQHEIIALGDNYNDQEMIEYAGMGVAMGNAPDAIKAVANYVTTTNNEDGVGKALHHLFQL